MLPLLLHRTEYRRGVVSGTLSWASKVLVSLYETTNDNWANFSLRLIKHHHTMMHDPSKLMTWINGDYIDELRISYNVDEYSVQIQTDPRNFVIRITENKNTVILIRLSRVNYHYVLRVSGNHDGRRVAGYLMLMVG